MMHLKLFLASRQPLPRPFVEVLCIVSCLGFVGQTIYAYRKGVIYFGHGNGSAGAGFFGKSYNRITRDADPKKFWRVFYLSVFLSILFFAASIGTYIYYPPHP